VAEPQCAQQAQRRDGGIDSTGKANDYASWKSAGHGTKF
jgi:hypothetical protein